MNEVNRRVCHACAGFKRDAFCNICDPDQSELAALREELVTTQRGKANADVALSATAFNLEKVDKALLAMQERLTAAEQRNAALEAMLNAVRMSSKELLMAWVPSDWEAKRAFMLSSIKPTESGASE